jgi:hypothetical protein
MLDSDGSRQSIASRFEREVKFIANRAEGIPPVRGNCSLHKGEMARLDRGPGIRIFSSQLRAAFDIGK